MSDAIEGLLTRRVSLPRTTLRLTALCISMRPTASDAAELVLKTFLITSNPSGPIHTGSTTRLWTAGEMDAIGSGDRPLTLTSTERHQGQSHACNFGHRTSSTCPLQGAQESGANGDADVLPRWARRHIWSRCSLTLWSPAGYMHMYL